MAPVRDQRLFGATGPLRERPPKVVSDTGRTKKVAGAMCLLCADHETKPGSSETPEIRDRGSRPRRRRVPYQRRRRGRVGLKQAAASPRDRGARSVRGASVGRARGAARARGTLKSGPMILLSVNLT